LNGIASGLALPVIGLKIEIELLVRKALHLDGVLHCPEVQPPVRENRDRREDIVAASPKLGQEMSRFAGVCRFAQNTPPKCDRGIGGQNDLAGMALYGLGFGRCDTDAVSTRKLARDGCLINVRSADLIRMHAELSENFQSPRTA
jgi:hypothetical protein